MDALRGIWGGAHVEMTLAASREDMSEQSTCRATTKSGKPCRNPAGADGYCHVASHGEPGSSQVSHSRAKFDPNRVASLITQCSGNISAVARTLGCSRRTVHNYVNEYEQCAEACEDAREKIVDDAEHALRDLIGERDFGAVRFTLRCWGKHRGWVEKQEVELTGKNGGPVSHTVDLSALSVDQLRQLRDIASEAQGGDDGSGD